MLILDWEEFPSNPLKTPEIISKAENNIIGSIFPDWPVSKNSPSWKSFTKYFYSVKNPLILPHRMASLLLSQLIVTDMVF